MNPADARRTDRPLLLLDIDGVISLFGFDPATPPAGHLRLVDGLPHWLSTAAGELVSALAADFELMWCSGWEDRADEHLPAVLGIPAGLPHLTFDRPPEGEPPGHRRVDRPARHWKLDAIDAQAGRDRPLAWIDDAFDASCHAWAADRPAPTLLVATDPAVGLTAAQAAELAEWARGRGRRGGAG